MVKIGAINLDNPNTIEKVEAISTVESDDAESTTIISSGQQVCERILFNNSPISA